MSMQSQRYVLPLIDVLLFGVAWILAYTLRFGLSVPSDDSLIVGNNYALQLKLLLPWVILTHISLFYALNLYQGILRYAGTTELRSIGIAGGAWFFLWAIINLILDNMESLASMPQRLLEDGSVEILRIPWIIVVLYALLSSAAAGGVRFIPRMMMERSARGNGGQGPAALIVGAGDVADSFMRSLQRQGTQDFRPICAVAEVVSRVGLRLHGIPVVGTIDKIPKVLQENDIHLVLIAMDDPTPERLRRIVSACEHAEVGVRMVPSIKDISEGRVEVAATRDVRIEDLLGRDPVQLELPDERNYLRGETVLITGAGGSIGSEIARQAAASDAARLLLLGKGENSIFEVNQELRYRFPKVDLVPIIADVRDVSRMRRVFEEHRPAVVLHAAAHKHVPLMEAVPDEAVKNNVLGTANVALLADEYGASRFVLISTDKAVRPVSVMGATKRFAESVVLGLAKHSTTRFVAVRFGNVLGSRGSVIPLFRRQIQSGGPVTVTHQDVTRYFMTIPEAVTLVLQAGSREENGRLYLLDMGEPIRIADLARNMITLSGLRPDDDIRIEYVGLRPGEKLKEELFAEYEKATKTEIEKLLEAATSEDMGLDWEGIQADVQLLAQLADEGRGDEIIALLMDRLGDYTPADSESRAAIPVPERPVSSARITKAADPSIHSLETEVYPEENDDTEPEEEPSATEPLEPLEEEKPEERRREDTVEVDMFDTQDEEEPEATETPEEGATEAEIEAADPEKLAEEIQPDEVPTQEEPAPEVSDEEHEEAEVQIGNGEGELNELIHETKELLIPPTLDDFPTIPGESREPIPRPDFSEVEGSIGDFPVESSEAPEHGDAPTEDVPSEENLNFEDETAVMANYQDIPSKPCLLMMRVKPGIDRETLSMLIAQTRENFMRDQDKLICIADAETVGAVPAETEIVELADRPMGAVVAEALEKMPEAGMMLTLGSDVLLRAGALENLAGAMTDGTPLVYSDFEENRDGDVDAVKPHDHDGCPHERFEFGPVIAYNAERLKEVGGIRPDLKYAWEYDIHLKLMEKAPFKCVRGVQYGVFLPSQKGGKGSAVYSPGMGPLGGFSYVFYPEDMEKEVTSVFEDAMKRRGTWIDHETAVVDHGGRTYEAMVTVVTPILNRVKYIGNAIEKLLAQTYESWEYIIVDNGSTDGTIEKVQSYAEKDPRIRLIHGKGGSIASALNEGIKAAKGKYIGQLDSDDEYAPTCVEKMVEKLESNPKCGLAISYYRLMDENGKVIEDIAPVTHGGYTRNQIIRRDGAGATRYFTKAVLEEMGYYDEEHYGNFGEDYDMVVKVGEKYDVERVHEVLYFYRRHADNTDVTRDPEMKYKNKNRARQEALRRRYEINKKLGKI